MNIRLRVINSILLCIIATFITFTSSTLFSSFPPHHRTEDGIFDMSDFTFNTHSKYPITSDFTRVSYDEETNFAVYEAYFLLPKSLKAFALRIPPIDADFCLYINDEPFFEHSSTEPYTSPNVKEYILDQNESNLVKISFRTHETNPYFTSPSLNPTAYRDFLIGSISSIYFFENLFVIFDVILISICIISMCFHFITFLYRNTNKIHMYFSILSISGVLGISLSNQRSITFVMPSISLALGVRLSIFVLFLRLFSILELEKISFTALHKRKTYNILSITNFLLIILSLIIPMPYTFYIVPVYYILILLSIIVAINEGQNSYTFDKNPLTRLILFGLGLIFLGSFSDLTHCFGINKTYSLFYVSQCVFIVIQSIVVSIDYSNQLKKNKLLTENLKQQVFDMQNNESSFIASHINPSYIYDTLDIVKDSIDKDQDKVDVLIQSLSKYLRHTFDYTTTNNIYSYKEELQLCYAFKDITTSKYPYIKINFDVDEYIPNVRIPMFSIMSLIENSVNLTAKKVLHPEIEVKVKYDQNIITFSVSDNGIGMSKSEIDFTLNHPHEKLTYGLYQTNQLLIDKCNSKLQINSVINKSTTIKFIIITDTEDEV